jgi:hypothetical protein
MTKGRSGDTQPEPTLAGPTESILGAPQLVAFVATRDPNRAKAFYRDTLGLHLVSEDQFALVFDVAGTMLRVTSAQEIAAAEYTVLGWQVPDIVQTAENLQKAHVELKRYGECSKTNVASGTHLAAPRSRGLKTQMATH